MRQKHGGKRVRMNERIVVVDDESMMMMMMMIHGWIVMMNCLMGQYESVDWMMMNQMMTLSLLIML